MLNSEEIEVGCEDAVAAMKSWIAALQVRDFDVLEKVLAPDFQFTCSPDLVASGRLDKAAFIAVDKQIYNSSIDILRLIANRLEGIVITTTFAEVHEEFRGDLGEGMPEAAKMGEMVSGHVFAYASAWRQHEAGEWECFSHNVLAMVK